MRVFWVLVGIVPAVFGTSCLGAQQAEPPHELVREVVFNELHDHLRHGFWRYWIEKHTAQATQLHEQVETADGPLTRLESSNGRPLDDHSRQQEQERLNRLINSPQEEAALRRAYSEDENRIGRIVALLPEAFTYEYDGEEDGCHRLRFQPNVSYAPHTIEARIFHAMSGNIWIDAKSKRLARLDGHLDENVDFGFGLLGRLYKGGWFSMQRVQVSPTDWKTARLEVHMSGRAMLFKTIARETSEIRGGFSAVPAGMSLAQGVHILEQAAPAPAPGSIAHVSPASFATQH